MGDPIENPPMPRHRNRVRNGYIDIEVMAQPRDRLRDILPTETDRPSRLFSYLRCSAVVLPLRLRTTGEWA